MLASLTLVLAAAAATPCEMLDALSTPQVSIKASSAPSGPFVAPGATPPAAGRGGPGAAAQPPALPAHCRVRLVLKPTSDSNINAELWLPAANWNGKFMAVGNGGFGGSIQGYGEMQTALRLGYATAGNDTGHSAADGPNGMFALGHPEKIVDFAYRAMHEMTATSKKLIERYYGSAPQFSYYKGCSTGGRQGAMAAQRYPEDFDGIIAGALANRHIQMHTAGVYRNIQLALHPEGRISDAKAAMVSKAVLDKCDTLKEGFLNNPRACSFDFSTLACKGADADSCLTPAQLKTVEQFYGGVKNSKGELIFSGQALGNPLPALAGPDGRGLPAAASTPFASGVSRTPTTTGRRSISIATCRSSTARSASWTPSIRTCRSSRRAAASSCSTPAGATPTHHAREHRALLRQPESEDGQEPGRLDAAVHGARHGPLPRRRRPAHLRHSSARMEAWREKGVAPAQITAFNPQSGLSRPLCAYPQYARYKGTGNFKDASNWACTAP